MRELGMGVFVAIVSAASAWTLQRASWNRDCRAHGFDGLYVATWYDVRAWVAADQCVITHGSTGLVVPRSQAARYEQDAIRIRAGSGV